MSKLVTPEDLAEQFGITVEEVHKYRRKKVWPCVKFGRNEVRFTAAQVEQIVAMQTLHATVAPTNTPRLAGQTERSARRSA